MGAIKKSIKEIAKLSMGSSSGKLSDDAASDGASRDAPTSGGAPQQQGGGETGRSLPRRRRSCSQDGFEREHTAREGPGRRRVGSCDDSKHSVEFLQGMGAIKKWGALLGSALTTHSAKMRDDDDTEKAARQRARAHRGHKSSKSLVASGEGSSPESSAHSGDAYGSPPPLARPSHLRRRRSCTEDGFEAEHTRERAGRRSVKSMDEAKHSLQFLQGMGFVKRWSALKDIVKLSGASCGKLRDGEQTDRRRAHARAGSPSKNAATGSCSPEGGSSPEPSAYSGSAYGSPPLARPSHLRRRRSCTEDGFEVEHTRERAGRRSVKSMDEAKHSLSFLQRTGTLGAGTLGAMLKAGVSVGARCSTRSRGSAGSSSSKSSPDSGRSMRRQDSNWASPAPTRERLSKWLPGWQPAARSAIAPSAAPLVF